MRDVDLFQLALDLVPPWMVKACRFDVDNKRLDIEIDFKTGGRFACPDCKTADCPVHDTVMKEWRHLDFLPGIRHSCTRARRVSSARSAAYASSVCHGQGPVPVLRCCSKRWP